VLSSLDDKIDLLHRQNKTLEQMAETLFRQWFVEEDGEDWGEGVLGDFFIVKTGKKNSNYGTDDGKYPFFTCSQKSILAPDYSFDGNAILLAGNGDFNIKRYSGKFEAYQRTYVLMPHEKKYFGFLILSSSEDSTSAMAFCSGRGGREISISLSTGTVRLGTAEPTFNIVKSINVN
jgi:type I restriction enzyme S subunit